MDHSAYPLLAPLLWLRVLIAGGVLLLLPGYLWVGRFTRGNDPTDRVVVSFATGLIALPLFGLAVSSLIGALNPWLYIGISGGMALVIGRFASYRTSVRQLLPVGSTRPNWQRWLVLASCVVMAIVVLTGIGRLVVPPGDASNHAFLVWRVAESGSMAQSNVFGPPHGGPDFAYFVGWQASAALLSELSRVAPYICSWYLPLLCLFLLPAAFDLLWRSCGWPAAAAALGALFLAGNQHFPVGVLGWSGFGNLVGWIVLPLVVLMWRAAGIGGSAWMGGAAGLSSAAMIHIHAMEMIPGLALAAVAIVVARRVMAHDPNASTRVHFSALAVGAGILLVAMLLAVRQVGSSYPVSEPSATRSLLQAIGRGLDVLLRSAGSWIPLRVFLLMGLILGLLDRRSRLFTATSLAFFALYVWMTSSLEPLGRWWGQFFYQEPSRVHGLQVFFASALAGLGAFWFWQRADGRAKRPVARVVLWAVSVVAVLGAYVRPVETLRGLQIVFSVDQYRDALQLRQDIAGTARIANLRLEGSQWAMHVSQRRFLQPAGWDVRLEGEDWPRNKVLALGEQPWTASALALRRDYGITHLYVGDRFDHSNAAPPDSLGWTRARFDVDPRFRLRLKGTRASVYEILWEESDSASAP